MHCQPPFQHSASNFLGHDQHMEEKSEITKSIEGIIESQEQKLKMINSQFPQNFQIQDPYSIFQVSQQEEELMDLDKSIKNLIQSENDFFQSVNRLKVKMNRLINIVKDKNEEALPTHFRPFSIALVVLIGMKNHGVLET